MHKQMVVVVLTAAMAIPALGGSKQQGTATLKEFQPTGVPDQKSKHTKHQVFDLTFDAATNEYVCRTSGNKSTNASEFVVGTSVRYEIDGQKVKIKTPENKSLECKIVRASLASPANQ